MIKQIREIEKAIECGYPYCALALALTIPDICGQVYCPSTNQKHENGEGYKKWFDDFVALYYADPNRTIYPNDSNIVFNGYACYLLRCAYLHSGNYDLKAQNKNIKIEDFRLQYTKPFPVFHMYDAGLSDSGEFTLYIDVSGLCKAICMAAEDYYNKVPDKSKFKDMPISFV